MAEPPSRKQGEPAGLGKTARGLRAAQPYVDAVWRLLGAVAVGVLAGSYLDRWLGTAPWILVGLSMLGMGVGFYAFLRAVLRLGKQ